MVDLTLHWFIFQAVKIVERHSRRKHLEMNRSSQDRSREARSGLPSNHGNILKIQREIAIWKLCFHPNVVKLIEVIDDPSSKKIYLSKLHALNFGMWAELNLILTRFSSLLVTSFYFVLYLSFGTYGRRGSGLERR
jgi:hypothetical protein